MRFLKSLAVVLHTLVFLAAGALLLALALNFFSSDEIMGSINYLCADQNAKPAMIIVGGVLILAGLLMAHINLGRMQSEKTIAFENPEGQVTVSLSAIEDFIKKSVRHLPEIKELRSSVSANKKGISVVCRATIFADSNIPETTERIQAIVKSKVQEMLGVEEAITIKINVIKISLKEKGATNAPVKDNEEASRRMPFRGVD